MKRFHRGRAVLFLQRPNPEAERRANLSKKFRGFSMGSPKAISIIGRTGWNGWAPVFMLACALAIWAVAGPGFTAGAQEKSGPLPIGMVSYLWGPTEDMVALKSGLESLGHRQGRDFVLGSRQAEGEGKAFASIFKQLAEDGAKVLYVSGIRELRAAQAAGVGLPVVFSAWYDPFENPRGRRIQVTGVVNTFYLIAPESLAIFKKLVPGARKVLLPYDARDSRIAAMLPRLRNAAKRLGLVLEERPLLTRAQAERSINTIGKGEVDGILPIGARLNISGYALLISIKQGIPALFSRAWMAEYGGLAAYGPSWESLGRHAAGLMHQIIKGKKAGEITVKYVNQPQLVINLRVAEKLGLRIDRKVLKLAARVIR